MVRPTCATCVKYKHLPNAIILLNESRSGYPDHYYLALGEMAQAEDELRSLYPRQADIIKSERKKLEKDRNYTPPFMDLIKMVDEYCEECELTPHNPSKDYHKRLERCIRKLKKDPHVNAYAVCKAKVKP